MERSGGGSELRFQRWCLLGLPINPGALPQADDECCAFGQTYMDSAGFNPPDGIPSQKLTFGWRFRVGCLLKFLQRLYQVPWQRAHPIENARGQWLGRCIPGGEHFQL
jgi:hypothetical protein